MGLYTFVRCTKVSIFELSQKFRLEDLKQNNGQTVAFSKSPLSHRPLKSKFRR